MIDRIHYEIPSAYTLQQVKKTESYTDLAKVETNPQQVEWLMEWGEPSYGNTLCYTDKNHWEHLKQFSAVTEEEIGSLQLRGYDLTSKTEMEILSMYFDEINQKEQQQESQEHRKIDDDREWANKRNKIKEQTEGMYRYALSEQQVITPNNLYKESFKTPSTAIGLNQQMSYTAEEVVSLINRNGLSDTPEVQNAVQQLLQLGTDITAEHVGKYINITDITDRMDENYDISYGNQVLMKGNRVNYSLADIEEIKACLDQVDDEMVDQLESEGKTINIKNLREQMLKNTEKILENLENKTVKLTTNADIVYQVKEIRARLNVETAQRLSEKMPLESEGLNKVAEGLRQVEQEVISDTIKSAQIPDTSENRKILEETIHASQVLKEAKGEAVHSYFKHSGTLSLEAVQQTLLNHEEASNKIEKILNQQGQPVTQLNKEAVAQGITTELNTATQKVLASKEVRELAGGLYNQEGEVNKLLVNGQAFKDLASQITQLQHSLKEQGIEWDGLHKQNIHRAIEEHPNQTQALMETINHLETQLGITKAQGSLKEWLNYPEVFAKAGNTLQQEETRVLGTVMNKLGIEATEENKALTKDLVQISNEYKDIERIKQLKTPQQLSGQLDRFLTAAEGVETAAQARFGEGINKVESQIAQILEDQGIVADSKNREAAKALIQNNIELTPEKIEEVRSIIETIDIISEELTPYKTAELMKEGVNPYKASLNHVAGWLLDGQTVEMKQSVAEAIVGLEEKGMITDTQKKGLIGVYRILNTMEVDKEKVIGYMYKNNLPITIEKLDEAIKYHGGGGIATQIDDTVGQLERLYFEGETARHLIDQAHQETSQVDELVNDLENKVLTGLNKDIQQVLKEEIKNILQEFNGKDVLSEQVKEKIDTINQLTPKVLDAMNKNDIPVTLNNVYNLEQFEKNIETYKKELMEDERIKAQLSEDLGSMREQLEEIENYIHTQKSESMLEGDVLSYKKYNQLEEIVQFQRDLEENHNIYVIPMMVEGQLKTVNFHINKKQSTKANTVDETTMVISYDTSQLGKIKAEVKIKGDCIDYSVSTSKKGNLEKLEKEQIFLKEKLQHIGFEVNQGIYDNEESQLSKVSNEGQESLQEAIDEEKGLFEMII